MGPRLRFAAALLAFAALFAAQLAPAASGCDRMRQGAMALESASAPAGHGMAVAPCASHCAPAPVLANGAEPRPATHFMVSGPSPRSLLDPDSAAARLAMGRAPLPPEPPPAIRFGVLRL